MALCLLTVVVAAGTRDAGAAIVVDEDVQTMAARADVVARVVVVDSFQAPGPRGRAVTWARLTVLEGLKSAPTGSALWLLQPGGATRHAVTAVAGALPLGVGDELVLFADRLPSAGQDAVVLYALGRGVFRVWRGRGTPRVTELVAPGTLAVRAQGAGGAPLSARTPSARWASRLSAFEDAVRLGTAGPGAP